MEATPKEAEGRLVKYDWHGDAACVNVNTDLFFPEKGQSATWAKKFCVDCMVRVQCLDAALAMPVAKDYGVWGGMTHEERVRERARRRRLEADNEAAS